MLQRVESDGAIPASATAGSPPAAAAGSIDASEPRPQKVTPPVADDAIDVPGSLRRMGGDWDLFREFVGMFDEDAPRIVAAASEAIRAHDASRLHRAAHTLKGLVLNFGASATAEAAYALEKMGRAGDLTGTREGFKKLETELVRLNVALQPYRSTSATQSR